LPCSIQWIKCITRHATEDAIERVVGLHARELAALADERGEPHLGASSDPRSIAARERQHDPDAGLEVARCEQGRTVGGELGTAGPSQHEALDRKAEQRDQM
jgi:hypothetical protein